jgi:hypothetical protein
MQCTKQIHNLQVIFCHLLLQTKKKIFSLSCQATNCFVALPIVLHLQAKRLEIFSSF